ncbi:uncharacterized protein PADG_11415 [Paracoccidioides brasiliensis Pb18]|uniref:Transcriptional regulatory protein RXT2 N-terminal domain-containing protein n=1 Tax=Paracoccidioides brasiliensis (strain Pb18) TaxID=502780 RepID=A0A0A0HW03_PARBD|nr:uncharacterized protein PADG_11415 [Paracoccidioides brasiliensis Pb18]KGM92583.1 hypothetical protein PADG_11415 [Paracoccidioides brasiliensis Pb18]
MAVQAAMIADTITAMKRALERQRLATGVDDPITQPTNRGNKLKLNAQYVHEGALGCMNGVEFYRKKINHAGYTRDILERNPPKYDSEGDELDEEDVDEHADPEMGDENPFADIHLEQTLAPLKHPSELATHPSMSFPYTSRMLHKMAEDANAKLRQEQIMLHKAKRLHRELLGDAPWMPCGFLETMEDRNIFDVNYGLNSSSKHGNARVKSGHSSRSGSATRQKDIKNSLSNNKTGNSAVNGVSPEQTAVDQDVEMLNAPEKPSESKPTPEPEETIGNESLRPNGQAASPPESTNGDNLSKRGTDRDRSPKPPTKEEPSSANEEPTNVSTIFYPEPPRRMTTRAQANQALNQPTTPTSGTGRSGSPALDNSDHDDLPVHPLFLLPPTHLDRTCGLPPAEADEVRRMLWSYIQKQEETVRASLRMYHMLLGACRKKDLVWEWCKAEGHVGEMSDGEDWYDREHLGLGEGEELRKGADEDEGEGVVEEGRATGKRGRGRRG